MFIRMGETTAKIKALVNHDWVWIYVAFRPQNLEKRGVKECKECNPKLIRKWGKFLMKQTEIWP